MRNHISSLTFLFCFALAATDGGYEKPRNLAEGWGFEGRTDSGTYSGPAEISGEYAFRGKKSLKMKLTGANDCVTLIPDITDWRPYKQLRFTLYLNPR